MTFKKKRNGPRPYDDPKYRQRRAQLMAKVTPETRCGSCGKLASEHPQRHRSGKPAGWQVGHTVPRDNTSPLRLEWSTCNLREGQRRGHWQAFGRYRAGAGATVDGVEAHEPAPEHYDRIGWAPPCVKATGKPCSACREFRAEQQQRYAGAGPHGPQHFTLNDKWAPCVERNGTSCPKCVAWHEANPAESRRMQARTDAWGRARAAREGSTSTT